MKGPPGEEGALTGQFLIPILETPLTGWMVGTTEASVAQGAGSSGNCPRPPVEGKGELGGREEDQKTQVFLRHHITNFPLCSWA